MTKRKRLQKAQKNQVNTQEAKPDKRTLFLVCIILAIVTIAAYWPMLEAGFVNYDDPQYVTENQHVLRGLTLDGLKWSFSTTAYAANWHPLTWLSHMLDCELFGQNAGLHHLTNLILHITSSVLLLLVLASMTGKVWPSAFVAAAFALHPLHVESVAWIAERKDVLSGLFWMLTMACYLRYTRSKRKGGYAMTLFVFGLGLMAKPMLVTLPFVLLLLDYWPLERLESTPTTNRLRAAQPLIVEKMLFLVLSAASCIVTYVAQKTGGAVRTTEFMPFDARLSNAVVSYVTYIIKMVWPVNLAVLYPFKHIPLWQASLTLLILVGITVIAVFMLREKRYFAVGWLWYLGTLVPVIGILQVGAQSHADRYTYIPLVGLFVIGAWTVRDFSRRQEGFRFVSGVSAILLLAGMFAGTRNQLNYWKDSLSLFQRAIQVTENNSIMHNNMGLVLAKKGQTDEAISHLSRAVQIDPKYARAHYNLGNTLKKSGRLDEAIDHLSRAVQIDPDYANAHNNLGLALAKRGQLVEAIDHYRLALQIDFGHARAHNNLGLALAKVGQSDEAISHYHRAVRIDSNYANAHSNLGVLYAKRGQLDKAITHFRSAVQIDPEDAEVHYNLGLTFAKAGQLDEAVSHYHRALRLRPEYLPVLNNLAWILSTAADPGLRDPAEAVRLAEKGCELTGHKNTVRLSTLAVTYAADSRFDEAILTAEKALEMAESAGNENLAQKIRARLELFKESRSYIEKPLIKDEISE